MTRHIQQIIEHLGSYFPPRHDRDRDKNTIMFAHLRNRLILVNMLVFTSIAALLLFTIYAAAYAKLREEQGNLVALTRYLAACDEPLIALTAIDHRDIGPVIYLRTSASGEITEFWPVRMDYGVLAALASEVNKTVKDSGIMYLSDRIAFSYSKARYQDGGQIILLSNLSPPQIFMHHLWIAVLLGGIAGLMFTLLGSWFMAEKSIAPIREAWQRQQNFVSDASHELRTPLAIIMTNLELVMASPEESVKSQETWLNNVLSEVKYMKGLVEHLTFLARLNPDIDRLPQNEVKLDELVKRTLSPLTPVLEEKELSLKLDVMPCSTWGNEQELSQLLIILLDNAVRYTPKGGTITVSLKPDSRKILLSVADTGVGIEPKHLPHIFDRFYRADPSRSDRGYGLGLAIARQIVADHKGQITVDSTPGQGTVFTVSLPSFHHSA